MTDDNGNQTCMRCMGTGISNHPDSNEICDDCKGSGAVAPSKSPSLLTERLIQAAVDYESGRCSRRELSEARAAVELAINSGDRK